MINTKELEKEITNISRKCFGINDETIFMPSYDLAFGDFYSDCLIKLAKALKKSVKEIFDIIYKELEQSDEIMKRYDVFLICDYLNVRLKSFKVDVNDIESLVSTTKSVLVYVPVLKTYSKSEFFRLAFKGFLHAMLLKSLSIKVKLFVGSNEHEVTDLHDIKNFSAILDEIYDKFIKNEDIINLIKNIDASSDGFDLFIVHIGANTYYQRTLSKEFFKTIIGQNHFVFRFHTKDWSKVSSEDEHEISDFLNDCTKDELVSLMFMLSSNKDYKEINYLDAKCECEDNFPYFLNETYKRIGKFFSIGYEELRGFDFSQNDSYRNIILRASLLNAVLYNALLFGNIGDFINYFDMLLREVGYTLNNPNFRAKIKEGKASEECKFVFNYVKVSISRFLNLV